MKLFYLGLREMKNLTYRSDKLTAATVASNTSETTDLN